MWTVYALNDGKPNPSQCGFGWWIREQGNHSLIEQSGAWQGFTPLISVFRLAKGDRALMILAPKDHFSLGCDFNELKSELFSLLAEPLESVQSCGVIML
jgi:hypothetical protein